MPYLTRIQGSQHCVFNKDTGKTVPGGCHPNNAEATKHMQALNINVHKVPVKKKSSSKGGNPHKGKKTKIRKSHYKWKGR